MLKYIYSIVQRKQQTLAMIGLLALILAAVFSITLRFVPADGDDLRLLSSVANTTNPMVYFAKDAGEGKSEYRPLLPISLWLVYHSFGVRASLDQLINLVLHFVNACLLLGIIRRVTGDNVLSFLLAGIFLISIHTVSPASWIADRPTLLVGLFLLLLLDHILSSGTLNASLRLSYITMLAILALMSKETGLIVILFACFASVYLPLTTRFQVQIFIVAAIIITAYMGLRLAIFGSESLSYVSSGHALGSHYDSWAALSPKTRLLASAENAATNFTGCFLPIFNWEGKMLSLRELSFIENFLIWAPTVLLVTLSYSRTLTTIQVYSLVIIAINSALNLVAFRYRFQYLSWLGACAFVAGSPSIKS